MNNEKKIEFLRETIDLLLLQKRFRKTQSYLLDYDFIREKTIFIGISELIEDYKKILKCEISNEKKKEALESILSALEQCSHIIKNYPKQINSQLIGYLEKGRNPFLNTIIETIDEKTKGVWLRPIIPSLSSQQGRLLNKVKVYGSVSNVEVAKNANKIITSCFDNGIVQVWDIELKELLNTFSNKKNTSYISVKMNENNIFSLAYDVDSKQTTLDICSLEDEKTVGRYSWKTQYFKGFNPNQYAKNLLDDILIGKFMISIESLNHNYVLKISHLPSFKLLQIINNINYYTTYQIKEKILFSKTEKRKTRIVTIYNKWRNRFGTHCIKIYELRWGKFRRIKRFLVKFTDLAKKIRVYEKLNIIVLWSSLSKIEIKIIKLSNGVEIFTLQKKIGEGVLFEELVVTGNGSRLLLFYSKKVEIWDIKLCKLEKKISNYTHNKFILSEDSNRIFTWKNNGELVVWDLDGGEIITSYNGWNSTQYVKVIDQYNIISSYQNYLSLWNLENVIKNPINHSQKIYEIIVLDYERTITMSRERVRVIDTENIRNLNSLERTERLGHSVFFEKENDFFIVSITNPFECKKSIKLWDITTNKCLHTFYGHERDIIKLKVINNGDFAISLSRDYTIKKWCLKTGQCVFSFYVTLRDAWLINTFEIYNNEKYLIFDDGKKTIMIYNLEYGYLVDELSEHDSSLIDIHIDKSEKFALSSSLDKTIILWDLKNRKILKRYIGHKKGVKKSIFVNIPNTFDKIESKYNFATHILSTSYDNTMKLWNLTTKKELFCFEGHSDTITELVLFKDNTKALTTSDDGMLIIWNLLTGDIINSLSIGRQISKASLTLDEKRIIIGELNGQLHFIKIEGDNFLNLEIIS